MNRFLIIAISIAIPFLAACDKKAEKKINTHANLLCHADNFFYNLQYDSAINVYYKILSTKNIQQSEPNYMKTLFGLALSYISTGKNDSAIVYYDKINKLCGFIKNNPGLLARFFLLQGNLHEKNYREFYYYIKKALHYSEFKTSADTAFLTRTYYNMGLAYYYNNSFDSAILYFKKASDLCETRKCFYNNEALQYSSNLALVYTVIGSYQLANEYVEKGKSIIKKNEVNDSIRLAHSYQIFSYYYLLTFDFESSLYYDGLAALIYSKVPRKFYKQLYDIYLDRAANFAYLKQFENAMINCNMASDILVNFDSLNKLDKAYLLFLKGYIYSFQENYDKARVELKKAIVRLTDQIPYYLPDLYFYYARCFLKTGSYDSSLIVLNTLIRILNNRDKCSSLNDNLYNLAWFDASYVMAKTYMAQNKQELAITVIRNSIARTEKDFGRNDYYRLKNICELGHFYLKKGDLPEAVKTYDEVLHSFGRIYASASPQKNLFAFMNEVLFESVAGKAYAYCLIAEKSLSKSERIKYLQKSLTTYEFLFELSDKQRKRTNFENDKLTLSETYDTNYSHAIQVSVQLYRNTLDKNYLSKAFGYSDNKKAHVVSDNLIDISNKKAGNIPDSLLKKEKELLSEINFNQSKINVGLDIPQLPKNEKSSTIEKLVSLSTQFDNLLNKFESEYPDYYYRKYKTQLVNSDSVANLLLENQSLIEYCLTEDSLFIMVLRKNSIDILSQPSAGIKDHIIKFRAYLSHVNNNSFTRDAFSDYIHNAYWLYKKLFYPVKNIVSGSDVIIVPDDVINLIPFEAFVTSDSIPGQTDYGLLSYLVRKYSLSYAYSAELYYNQQKTIKMLVDGAVTFAPDYRRFKSGIKLMKSGTSKTVLLNPIEGSLEESKIIINEFGGITLNGDKATKKNFEHYASSGSVLHLAMHTVVDNEQPMYSKLVFMPGKGKGNSDDYFLNTYEIYDLDIKSPLVVLSACNTGYGKLMKGEGLISLSRGFLYAGCPSMVITLWSIADLSSSRLMGAFYKNLKGHQTINTSLQSAKVEYITNSDQRNSHPYYWAGYIQVGKISSLDIKEPNKLSWIVTGLSLLVIGCLLFFYFKNRK
jgi:CHAT domain-containing protein